MKILGFIPARGGSKGIPEKNIYPLNGKPLIAYTIEEALKSKVNRLIVSTDSSEIADVSRKYGAEVPFLRPAELAQNTSAIEDAMLDALEKMNRSDGYSPDLIVLLHPTSPLRTAKHIDESIELLLEKEADSIVSVSEPMEHPCDMVYWDSPGEIKFLVNTDPGRDQRQAYADYCFLNGAVYVFTRETLRQFKSRFGPKTYPYMMKQIDSIDVDSMDDLLIAEALLTRREPLSRKG